jgi:hypothetical protein
LEAVDVDLGSAGFQGEHGCDQDWKIVVSWSEDENDKRGGWCLSQVLCTSEKTHVAAPFRRIWVCCLRLRR